MADVLLNTTLAAVSPTPPLTNTTLVRSGIADKATRATFLSLFIIVGFVGNSVLIASIAQSARLKSSTINLCILSLAVGNILDSAGNMPLILGATIREQWDYGLNICRLNAFGLQLVSIVIITGLMVLTLDRLLAIRDPLNHNLKASRRRISGVIAFSWLHALAFSIPLLLDSVVPITVFPVRYLCTITNNTPLVYLCLTSIFAYLAPILMSLSFFCYIAHRGLRQQRKDKALRSQDGYVEGAAPRHKMWAEMEGVKYAGALFVLWCVLQGPYLVLSSIMWYKNSRELSGVREVTDFLHFEYPWELELALTWLKLSYAGFLPAVTFLWKKDIWIKFKNKLLCRKTNLIIDASPKSSPQHGKSAATAGAVPVLFATENGLHFQTYDDDNEADAETEVVKDNSLVITKECDVLQLDDDTSDYDSSGEIDPFSNSNPISVRTEYGRQKSHNSSNNSRLSNSQQIHVVTAQITADTSSPRAADQDTTAKAKKRVHKKDSTSSVGGELNPAYLSGEPGPPDHHVDVVMEAQGAEAQVERTSHDSGMGSLDKYKKVTRKYKAKANDEMSTIELDGREASNEADSAQESAAATKKKKKTKRSVSVEDEAFQDGATPAPKTKPQDGAVSRPTPAPRTSLSSKKDLEAVDTQPSTDASSKPKPSERKSKRPKSAESTRSRDISADPTTPPKVEVTESKSHKRVAKDRPLPRQQSREQDKIRTATDPALDTLPAASVNKKRKKKAKKSVEAHRQQLDEDIQGVIY